MRKTRSGTCSCAASAKLALTFRCTSQERIAENFDIFDFELTADEMNSIATLDTGTSSFFDHRDPAMVKWLIEAKRPT